MPERRARFLVDRRAHGAASRPDAAASQRSFSVVYPDAGARRERLRVAVVVAATGVTAARATPTRPSSLRDLPALVRHQDEPFPSLGRLLAVARDAAGRARPASRCCSTARARTRCSAAITTISAPTSPRSPRTDGLLGRAGARRARGSDGDRALPRLPARACSPITRCRSPRRSRDRARAGPSTHAAVPDEPADPAWRRRLGPPRRERASSPATPRSDERRAALLETSLPALLRYEDRNSMAFSIEARTPFLDYRLVERALALPARELIRDGWTKALLREAMRGLLPEIRAPAPRQARLRHARRSAG